LLFPHLELFERHRSVTPYLLNLTHIPVDLMGFDRYSNTVFRNTKINSAIVNKRQMNCGRAILSGMSLVGISSAF